MAYPNLKAEMARFDRSMQDVADAAGVEVRTVQNWTGGKSTPTVAQCMAVRDKLFGFATVDYLFNREPITF